MTDPSSALNALLSEQADRVHRLNALLQDERQALVSRDMNGLQGVLSRKVELLGAVEAAERQRMALAQQITGNAEPNMEACLRQLPDADTALARWSDLLDALRECRAVNEANGGVIRHQQRGVSRTMELLDGDNPPRENDGYGPAAPGGAPGPVGREISQA